MNNFKAAHAIARNTLKSVGDYKIAFSLALKLVYKAVKSGYKLEAIISGTIKSWAGAMVTSGSLEKSQYVSSSIEKAQRFIKENKVNAGKIWESKGQFYFYVYA